jgi:hypothetical protein
MDKRFPTDEENELVAAFFHDKVIAGLKKLARELAADPDFAKIKDFCFSSIEEMLESAAEHLYLEQFPPGPSE